MDRRTAVAGAAAVVLIALTGAAAIGANLGVVQRAPADPAGQLQPNDAELTTVVVEPAAAPAQANARYSDDEHEDEDEHEDDDRYEHDEDDEDEYEGRDDDD